ncbi:hypothetical protein T12_14610 [Trichinella patagoniensis]|uniref:Uncharacterized protein n=1 Tax=Trichinella patagoniensis TaxID=990121 RepID=A0A0V0Z1U3_9BILA|nr:hypothetical protein T12_14610 [Trichinella patagoniensis]
MDYILSRVLGKGAHCIVKLENFTNSAIMEWFDSKFFRLPLKWKLQAALVSPETDSGVIYDAVLSWKVSPYHN